jgi:lipocalin
LGWQTNKIKYMVVIYKTKEAQEQFIAHLKYLLKLSRNAKLKRKDWQAMKKILQAAGYIFHKSRKRKKSGHQLGFMHINL